MIKRKRIKNNKEIKCNKILIYNNNNKIYYNNKIFKINNNQKLKE